MARSRARSSCRRPVGCAVIACARTAASARISSIPSAPPPGPPVDGLRYGSIEATVDRAQGSNVWLSFAIREGKNREVKTVLGPLGLEVNRLIRVSFGPFQLAGLASGEIAEVKTRTLR